MAKPNSGPRLRFNKERRVYEIHWTDAGRSKRSSTRTSDFASAQKVLAAFLTLHDQDERRATSGPRLVMDVLGDPDMPDGDDYWHEHVLENVVDKVSARQATAKLKRHFGHMAVADILPADVDAYVKARRAGRIGRPSVNHTISRELSVLNAAINHDVRAKRTKKGDQPFIQLPGTSPPRDRWLTREEADKLLKAAAEHSGPRAGDPTKLTRIYRFVALALHTAGRMTAIKQLTRGQVDRERGLIYLNPKGRNQTKKKRATVPISDELAPILDAILAQIPDRPDAYLLDHSGCIYTSFDRAVERAKLKDVTPHVLRHTKATWMAQAGVDLWRIAGVLGDTLATVEKTYLHHQPEYLRSAINAGPSTAPALRVVGGSAA